ncbi:MAG: RdgB/HAM1 family non-canonical purine NTP pyrophosphatase [Acidimicrobiales bacterium]
MVGSSSEGSKKRLVVASSNSGKIAELVELLGDRYLVEQRPADLPETIEDADTLEGNAQKKAQEVTDHTSATALADDTGLFVTALGGRPGVRTARYAGEDADNAANIAKLLGELAGSDDRSAEFRTVIALTEPDGTVQLSTGTVAGKITEAVSGEAGFGYDPVFVPDEGDGRTFAEMTSAEKGAISHRGRALRGLLDQLDS